MRSLAWIVAFAACIAISWQITETAANLSEDHAALASLDNAFRDRADASVETDRHNRALNFIHKVIYRITGSFIKPLKVMELANFATITLRRHPPDTLPEDLARAVVNTLMRRLGDPYATYEERSMLRENKRIGRIGIEAAIVDGKLTVISPLDGSPAQRAGIEPGDIITAIDKQPMRGYTLLEAMQRVRGPIGTDVFLEILRENKAQKLDLPVPRTHFRVRSLRHLMFGNIAYLRIAYFGPDTEIRLRKSLTTIQNEIGLGVLRGYILDLRNNPGGLVGQAVLIADAFLEKGLIIETIGRELKGARRYDAHQGDFVKGLPLVVLQNQASASAAEILSSALKDNGRAIIIGTRSYGKGLLQTAFPLGALGRIKFTTHKYMTPSGRPIHDAGIMPNIVVNGDPRPTSSYAAIPIDRCPAAGKARDRILGCALLYLNQGQKLDVLLQGPPRKP